MRASGILMHISSLPGKYGIGKLGQEAYDFVDFLVSAKQTYWQVLPISPTSYGDSPYQSFSVFAGNPYFIDFDALEKEGLLKKSQYDNVFWGESQTEVDYSAIYQNIFKVLKIAYKNFSKKSDKAFDKFIRKNKWTNDYGPFYGT